MKLIKAERPSHYTGPIKECPNQEIVEISSSSRQDSFEQAYAKWSDEFFKNRPRGRLTHDGFFGEKLVVRGTGDNGLWLVAWWVEPS